MAIGDVPRVVGGAVFRDEDFHRDRGRHADPQHPPTHPPTPPHPPHPPTPPTHPTLTGGATFFRPRCGLNDLCDRLPPTLAHGATILSPALRAGQNILCGLGGCGSVANDLHPSK